MLSRRALAVLLATPLLLTSACGGVERDLPSERAVSIALPSVAATINPAPPTTAAPSKAPAKPASGSAPASPEPAAVPNQVQALIESKFAPETLDVKVGTEVTFVNVGGIHSVTGGDGTPDAASPIGNNEFNADGASAKIKFDTPGTYLYYCTPHLSVGMKGKIVVA